MVLYWLVTDVSHQAYWVFRAEGIQHQELKSVRKCHLSVKPPFIPAVQSSTACGGVGLGSGRHLAPGSRKRIGEAAISVFGPARSLRPQLLLLSDSMDRQTTCRKTSCLSCRCRIAGKAGMRPTRRDARCALSPLSWRQPRRRGGRGGKCSVGHLSNPTHTRSHKIALDDSHNLVLCVCALDDYT